MKVCHEKEERLRGRLTLYKCDGMLRDGRREVLNAQRLLYNCVICHQEAERRSGRVLCRDPITIHSAHWCICPRCTKVAAVAMRTWRKMTVLDVVASGTLLIPRCLLRNTRLSHEQHGRKRGMQLEQRTTFHSFPLHLRRRQTRKVRECCLHGATLRECGVGQHDTTCSGTDRTYNSLGGAPLPNLSPLSGPGRVGSQGSG